MMKIDPKNKATWPDDTDYHHGYVLQVDESKAKNRRFYRVSYRVVEIAPYADMDKMLELEIEKYEPTFYGSEYSHAVPMYSQCKEVIPCDADGWIDADENKPDPGESVYCADIDSCCQFSGVYTGKSADLWFRCIGIDEGSVPVTHWQPAPPMPKGE
jgi:hypothetical protein